jgi:hypothetical protein
LLSEAQVILHQHPLNAARVAAGKPPVNSLWFWGGSVLPDHVTTRHAQVHSDEVTLRALAKAAGVDGSSPSPQARAGLIDVRAERDLGVFISEWLQPALDALRTGDLAAVHLDCEDGVRFTLTRSQRWRFWRKPLAAIDA